MIQKLHVAMIETAKLSNYNGYFYKLEDVLTTMVLGLLCGLKTVESIYYWSNVPHVQNFLEKEFQITKLPKKSQFYLVLTFVNHKQFAAEFVKWANELMQGNMEGKTVAIDGKSICSTAKLSQDKKIVNIASAVIADIGLIIASQGCNSSLWLRKIN